MTYHDLLSIEYAHAWAYQLELFDKALKLKAENQPTQSSLLLCEHPHTITLGKNADKDNLLFDKQFLKKQGVALFQIDRGGDVTYHGPGQVVGYPIFDLEVFGIGLKQYIHNLEEIIIKLLDSYDIRAERLEGAAGVWIDVGIPLQTRKIAAIGVRCSRFVTMHGFALNVNTNLNYFNFINPCGFVDKGVTSIERELGHSVNMEEVKARIKALFEDIFTEKIRLLPNKK